MNTVALGRVDLLLEEYIDGVVLISNNTEEIVKQCVGRDDQYVMLIDAYTPWDINEIYPGWEKIHWTEANARFHKLSVPSPKFHLSQLCYYYGKRVWIRSRYFDFRDNHWRYIVGMCRNGEGAQIIKERKLWRTKNDRLLKDSGV